MATGISSATSSVLGKDAFMKMLIAQLRNQDPLNPLNGQDFAAQLAQFSSLEQLTNVNSTLESLTANMTAMNNSQMSGLIGCDVTARGNQIQADGTVKTLSYTLPEDVGKGTVKIYDGTGALVKSVEFGTQKAGTNTVTWDSSGRSGTYTFDVTGLSQSGKEVSGTTLVTGKVSGVNFKNGLSYLVVNGQEIAFNSLVSVKKGT